jgi:8-oxo-dGTP pyrophosphatase MutT (NUDIX family)
VSLFDRLEEGRKPTKSELAKGKKPKDVTWKDWLSSGGAFQGKTKKPKKPKKSKRAKLPKGSYQDVGEQGKKLTKARLKKQKQKKAEPDPSDDWFAALTKGMETWDIDDDETAQLGWWGLGGSTQKGRSKLPPKKLSPHEEKVNKIARSIGKIKRTAAGGVVFKTFSGPDMWDLPVLVSLTAPKWGSYWVFPKGGLDLGETIYKGAAREVREEAGVKAKVASPLAYKTTSTFGESGKYDLPLVIDLLKKKNPSEAEWIEKHKEDFRRKSFTFANQSHYFVMAHKGGRPRQSIGKDEEMARSEWMPLRKAIRKAKRGEVVIKFLLPVIHKLWKPTGGMPKPSRPSKPPSRRPRPFKSHKPKASPKIKPSSTGGSYSFLWWG